MRLPVPRRLMRRAAAPLLVGAALALTGCQAPQPGEPTTRAAGQPAAGGLFGTRPQTPQDNITTIVTFYQPLPWLYDPDSRVIGFRVPAYFVDGASGKGVFVPGNILVWLYRLYPQPDGTRAREFVHGWKLTEADAMGYRVVKPAIGGRYYGLVLFWPRELNLGGEQIEIVVGYERLDGQIVTGPPRSFDVPAPRPLRRGGVAPPHRTAPAPQAAPRRAPALPRPELPPPEPPAGRHSRPGRPEPQPPDVEPAVSPDAPGASDEPYGPARPNRPRRSPGLAPSLRAEPG